MYFEKYMFKYYKLFDKMFTLFRCFKGVLYCYLWAASILAGYAGLFCPLLPLIFISNKLYRYLTDFLFTFWQMYPTALLQLLCGTRIVITGDSIVPGTSSLLVMNHRTRTDWNFLWPAVYHATCDGSKSGERGGHRYRCLHPLKFVLKDAIRHIPGPGWVMQLACFVYIKRLWSTDKHTLESLVDYFTHMKYKFTMVIFPEGTDLTRHTQNSSNRHADKYGLQKYEYVLHPRTKGFTYLASDLLEQNALDCIYDVTLLYPDCIPQTEKEILKGHFPQVVRMHFKRYNKEVLPKTEAGLKQFLEELWKRKEQSLKDHYDNGNFLTGPKLQRNSSSEIYLAIIFWTLLPIIVLYLFVIYSFFRKLVTVHTAFLLILNLFNGGFQHFETGVYNIKRKFFKNPW